MQSFFFFLIHIESFKNFKKKFKSYLWLILINLHHNRNMYKEFTNRPFS